MRFGTITPTDVDAFIEYNDVCFVFIEAKHKGAELPYGQQLAFERLCDNSKKPAILLVGEHTHTATEVIDFAAMTVTRFYYNGKWRTPKAALTVREATDLFLEFV